MDIFNSFSSTSAVDPRLHHDTPNRARHIDVLRCLSGLAADRLVHFFAGRNAGHSPMRVTPCLACIGSRRIHWVFKWKEKYGVHQYRPSTLPNTRSSETRSKMRNKFGEFRIVFVHNHIQQSCNPTSVLCILQQSGSLKVNFLATPSSPTMTSDRPAQK